MILYNNLMLLHATYFFQVNISLSFIIYIQSTSTQSMFFQY